MYKFYEIHDNGLEELIHTEHKTHLSNKDIKNIYSKLNCNTLLVTNVTTKENNYIWKNDKWEISIYN